MYRRAVIAAAVAVLALGVAAQDLGEPDARTEAGPHYDSMVYASDLSRLVWNYKFADESQDKGWIVEMYEIHELTDSWSVNSGRKLSQNSGNYDSVSNTVSLSDDNTTITHAFVSHMYPNEPQNFTVTVNLTYTIKPAEDVDTEMLWDPFRTAEAEIYLNIRVAGWRMDPTNTFSWQGGSLRLMFLVRAWNQDRSPAYTNFDCPGSCTMLLVPAFEYEENNGPNLDDLPKDRPDDLGDLESTGDEDVGVGPIQIRFPDKVLADDTELELNSNWWEEYEDEEAGRAVRYYVTMPAKQQQDPNTNVYPAYNEYRYENVRITVFSGANQVVASVALLVSAALFALLF